MSAAAAEAAPPRSPRLAAGLSALLPGLGQLYAGERATGIAALCASAGILGGIALAVAGPPALRSWTTVVLLAFVYPFLWLPAVRDAHRRARGAPSPLLAGEQVWYVVFMLATVGPLALPLLWYSPRFSRRLKLWLTAAVVALALVAVAFTVWVGPWLEAWVIELFRLLQGLPEPAG